MSKPAESTAALNNARTQTPSFVADVWGNYVVQLRVTDQAGLESAPDEVRIGIDLPPSADAGIDQLVVADRIVTLSASGVDADGDAFTFAWTLAEKPATSAALLNQPNTANPTFVPDVPGVYVAQLTVSDFLGGGTPDSVKITAISAENYAETQIQMAAEVVSGLPQTNLTSEGNRRAFLNYLSHAVQFIETGHLTQARQELEAAIARTDGCALRGTPDGAGTSRDWITTCDAQDQVHSLLADALSVMVPEIAGGKRR